MKSWDIDPKVAWKPPKAVCDVRGLQASGSVGPGRPRKVGKRAAPVGPKRAMSAYTHFFRDHFPEAAAGGKSAPEASVVIGQVSC